MPHHLIDVLDPWESANVAWWLDRADGGGRRHRGPRQDGPVRRRHAVLPEGAAVRPVRGAAGRRGAPRHGSKPRPSATGRAALHARLAAVDPASARRLHPNDVRRVVRALEVWHLTGKPISDWQQQAWWDGERTAVPAGGVPVPDFTPGRTLCPDRSARRAQCSRRAGSMKSAGSANRYIRLSREAAQALGYREIGEHLDGRRSLAETDRRGSAADPAVRQAAADLVPRAARVRTGRSEIDFRPLGRDRMAGGSDRTLNSDTIRPPAVPPDVCYKR